MRKAGTKQRSIFILQSQDELRHPYAKAFESISDKVVWFTNSEEVLSQSEEEPAVLIIDLDLLQSTSHAELQQFRSVFSRTDLIATSTNDSAQLALSCIRSGFSDFLVKPASPEELVFSIKKCWQRQDVLSQLEPEDPRTGFARAVSQISGAGSPTLVRHYSLEYLRHLLRSEAAAWISDTGTSIEVLCSSPRQMDFKKIIEQLPSGKLPQGIKEAWETTDSAKKTSLILPGQDYPKSAVFVSKSGRSSSSKNISLAMLLLSHAELTLLNLEQLEELKQQTFVDDLTGLYNSRFLKYAVTNSIVRCKEPGDSFSVLFVDVDHFKSINDQYGHVVGSEFLVAIGRTIKNAIRGIDPAFRYGGDEFVVILNKIGTAGAKEIAERIRKHIERRVFFIKGQQLRTTVSIGIANYPEHAQERESLLKLADEAMYSAKKSTRNAVHLAVGLEVVKSVPKVSNH